MTNPKLRPLFESAILAGVAFLCHFSLLFFLWADRIVNWRYSITALYTFFFLCSIVIVRILIRTKTKNIDSVGSTFMLLTCVKAVLAYILVHPILSSQDPDAGFEKMNFLAVFSIFLTIETIVSIRLLQKK